uniref:SFRICE_018903 n=1 Tax=Spodoptera frugiperda TaxID=7108 RepID=A0A2H1WLG4_SPOFR
MANEQMDHLTVTDHRDSWTPTTPEAPQMHSQPFKIGINSFLEGRIGSEIPPTTAHSTVLLCEADSFVLLRRPIPKDINVTKLNL